MVIKDCIGRRFIPSMRIEKKETRRENWCDIAWIDGRSISDATRICRYLQVLLYS